MAFWVRVQFDYNNGNEKVNIVAAVIDSDFGFSDGDSSRQEDGEDNYAYRGNTAIERQRICQELDSLNNPSGVMLQTLKTSKKTQK